MEAMLAYLLKVSVSAILFYLFIRILMERETQHEYIRGLWIGAIVFSLVLPFVYVPVPDLFPEKAEAAESMNIIMSGGEPEMLRPEETYTAVDWIGILGYIYIAGAAIVSILYVVSFIRLYIRIKRTPRTHEYDSILRRCAEESGCSRNVRLRVTDDSTAGPYSWMRNIVISRQDMECDGEDIILHEMGHISRGHSWDTILTGLFTCILWFNPASWLIQYSIRQIHEYSADSTVLRSGADAREYQTLLIRKAAGAAYHSIANSFNHSNLKNRITMMLQNQTSKSAYAKSLALLPVLACLLFVFSASRPAPSDKVNEIPAETETSIRTQSPADVKDEPEKVPVVKKIEKKAIPDDFRIMSKADFLKWANTVLVYSQEAKSAGKYGTVKASFKIKSDGTVGDIVIKESPDEIFSQEVRRVIASSPEWSKSAYQHIMMDGPGCVEFSVGFCLKSEDKDGNTVWLGSEVGDPDIAVMAFADNALEARAMKK